MTFRITELGTGVSELENAERREQRTYTLAFRNLSAPTLGAQRSNIPNYADIAPSSPKRPLIWDCGELDRGRNEIMRIIPDGDVLNDIASV